MVEVIRHSLGLCSDNHTHLDLTDILIYGIGSISISMIWIRLYARVAWTIMVENFNVVVQFVKNFI